MPFREGDLPYLLIVGHIPQRERYRGMMKALVVVSHREYVARWSPSGALKFLIRRCDRSNYPSLRDRPQLPFVRQEHPHLIVLRENCWNPPQVIALAFSGQGETQTWRGRHFPN